MVTRMGMMTHVRGTTASSRVHFHLYWLHEHSPLPH
jgi:hypothetical protein